MRQWAPLAGTASGGLVEAERAALHGAWRASVPVTAGGLVTRSPALLSETTLGRGCS